MRLVKGSQLWVAERRGRVVYTRGGKASAPGVPKLKEHKTETAAQAWLEAERAKRVADGFEVVDEAAGIDAPFTATGKVAARKVPPRFAVAADTVRMHVRGGFRDADEIATLIDDLAREHARTVGAARDARLRPGMTMEERALDERIATAGSGDGAGESVSEAAEQHLKDVLHEIAREERDALRGKSPPDPDINAAIDRAFARLEAANILALQATGYTQSDGWAHANAIATKASRGACFYHEQDLEHGIAGKGLLLSFGAYGDHDIASIAREIVAALRAEGVDASWSGDPNQRIAIAPFAWFRRPE